MRFPTRWCHGDADLARCSLLVLLTLRGTPVLYYGDEIGMEETDVDPDRIRDVAGRDGARTPMHWSARPGAGFTVEGVTPWLPFGDLASANVEDERADPSSLLTLCRDLIALRRTLADLRRGSYTALEAPPGVWAWQRGEGVVVAVNLSSSEAMLPGIDGTVRLGTDASRDGDAVDGRLALRPREGVILARALR